MNTKEENGRTYYQDPTGHWIPENWLCHQCLDEGKVVAADERFSLGIYAGKYCDKHWKQSGFRKEGPSGFHPDDAGESYDPI